MRWKIGRYLAAVLVCISVLNAGCGPATNSAEITKLEKAETAISESSEKPVESLKEKNELPGDGIVTQAQMKTITGKDGNYEFSATDQDTGITYIWTYEGKKIQNPIEQKLKVQFPDEKVEEIKKAANNATVGLGLTLDKGNLAAPVKLTLILTEKWDADSVILCKMTDKGLGKMCDVTLDTETKGDKEVTRLSFPVTETGDTYYLVGGKTKVEDKTEDADTGSTSAENRNQTTENAAPEGEENQQESNRTEASGHTCTISIECSTILDNWDNLKQSKSSFVPSDGWIMGSTTVEYTPGETVYDVLYRVCRDNKLHMDASYTPAYSSYYVKGINQLYEFDCGELSGWMYRVNGWYPNYGCSKYEVSDGDNIEWRYTCDLGRDVGDQYMGDS